MQKRDELFQIIENELSHFNSLNHESYIVPNSIPIVWFGNAHKYFESPLRIITVSLNPSDKEFEANNLKQYSSTYRFPSYNKTIESLFKSYNEYFIKSPYDAWFKSSFGSVLKSFKASHYEGEANAALHTDIGSSFATNPTWSGLSKPIRQKLEIIGSSTWHNLIRILEPNVILFSASPSFEKKIRFNQIGTWKEIDVKAKRPLLLGEFEISKKDQTSVLFQVQGRKPFLQTSKEEKLKFYNHI